MEWAVFYLFDRHVGDLGNIEEDADGKVVYEFPDREIRLTGPHNIVGKSVVVSDVTTHHDVMMPSDQSTGCPFLLINQRLICLEQSTYSTRSVLAQGRAGDLGPP